MSIYSLYFSPTGGTKKVADLVLKEFDVDTYIDLSDANVDYSIYSFSQDDICFISVPSFGGRVPHVVLDRLNKMKADGAYAVLVVSYGNREFDDTLLELKNETEKIGFLAVAAVAAVTEHSIVRKFASGRPDDKDEAELYQYSRKLKNMFDTGGFKSVCVPGNETYKKYNGVPLKPDTNKDCNKCGLCAKLCPVNAIEADNPSETDKDKCITCMRCIAVCPQNARSINKAALFLTEERLKKACSIRKSNKLFLGN
ncbi:hypothetical protein SDC9_158187 [bioreactor metagenome]|uniref:4Fe-4S ferredoxin-type domain-containing protein n=1 Tax=bioreactor metagenome TaxID=1076179 RepID=A0A645FAG6_9ZZZZ